MKRNNKMDPPRKKLRNPPAIIMAAQDLDGTKNVRPTRIVDKYDKSTDIHYYQGEIIGSGISSIVYRGYFGSANLNQKAAIKRLECEHYKVYLNEVRILTGMSHPNVVRYFSTCKSIFKGKTSYYIAMELGDSTLEKFMEGTKSWELAKSKSILTKLLKDTCLGLEALHYNKTGKIIHRDIKPSNILVMQDYNGVPVAKLTDFGISRLMEFYKEATMSYGKGTIDWSSPLTLQAIDNSTPYPCSAKDDIFSLGLTCYYILSYGIHPCGGNVTRTNNILTGNINFQLSEELQNSVALPCITKMLEINPEKRPRIKNILKYPWFWKASDTLRFFTDCSDYLSSLTKTERAEIEHGLFECLRLSNWKENLDADFCQFLNTQSERKTNSKKYDGNSILKLIELIRDKDAHFKEVPKHLKADHLLGEETESYILFFTSRFPQLLPSLYSVMQKFRKQRKLKDYYDEGEFF